MVLVHINVAKVNNCTITWDILSKLKTLAIPDFYLQEKNVNNEQDSSFPCKLYIPSNLFSLPKQVMLECIYTPPQILTVTPCIHDFI